MSGQRYDMLVAALKNIILQGAPGVGKTFTAAYSIMGEEDDTREFIRE